MPKKKSLRRIARVEETDDDATEHEVEHETNECNLWDDQLLFDGNIEDRYETASDQPKVQCLYCEEELPQGTKIRMEHIESHRNESGKFSCPKCSASFATYAGVVRHLPCHQTKEIVKRHRRRKFNVQRQRASMPAGGEAVESVPTNFDLQGASAGSHTCFYCAEVLPAQPRLYSRHYKVHEIDGKHCCPVCQKLLPNFKYFSRHYKRQHLSSLECNLCHLMCGTVSHLKTHMSSHAKFPHFCFECYEGYTEREGLMQHTLKEHQVVLEDSETHAILLADQAVSAQPVKTEIACGICLEVFVRHPEYKQHIKSHVVDGRFPCPYCKITLKDMSVVRRHVQVVHGKSTKTAVPTTSAESDISTESLRHVVETKGTHGRVSDVWDVGHFYKCRHCRTSFSSRRMLVQHMELSHPAVSLESVPELCLPVKEIEGFYCHPCHRVDLLSEHAAKKHIERVHEGVGAIVQRNRTVFWCEQCDMTFERPRRYVCHLNVHPELKQQLWPDEVAQWNATGGDVVEAQPTTPIVSITGRYECIYCAFRTHSPSILCTHYPFHMTAGKYDCPGEGCEKIFDTYRQTRMHYVYAHKDQTLQCPGCPFTASMGHVLKSHIAVQHSEENSRWVTCRRCYRSLEGMNALVEHVQLSHPEAILKISDNLDAVHQEIPAYRCSYCKACFSSEHFVDMHQQQQHAGKGSSTLKSWNAFWCTLCGIGLTTGQLLLEHVGRHRLHELALENVGTEVAAVAPVVSVPRPTSPVYDFEDAVEKGMPVVSPRKAHTIMPGTTDGEVGPSHPAEGKRTINSTRRKRAEKNVSIDQGEVKATNTRENKEVEKPFVGWEYIEGSHLEADTELTGEEALEHGNQENDGQRGCELEDDEGRSVVADLDDISENSVHCQPDDHAAQTSVQLHGGREISPEISSKRAKRKRSPSPVGLMDQSIASASEEITLFTSSGRPKRRCTVVAEAARKRRLSVSKDDQTCSEDVMSVREEDGLVDDRVDSEIHDSDDDPDVSAALTEESSDEESIEDAAEINEHEDDNDNEHSNRSHSEESISNQAVGKIDNTTGGCIYCPGVYDENNRMPKNHKKGHRLADGTFSCPVCSRHYPSYGQTRRHHRNHAKSVCTVCQKVLAGRGTLLRRHMKVHLKAPYLCYNCKRNFTEQKLLHDHIVASGGKCHEKKQLKTSAKEKKNREAKRSGSTPGKLRSYTKSKQRKLCIYCLTWYPLAEYLQHRLLHRVEDKFPCPLCETKCDKLPDLNRHIQHLHPVKAKEIRELDKNLDDMKVCAICGSSFASQKFLDRHAADHKQKDTNFFKCRECPLNFVYRSTFMQHLDYVHPQVAHSSIPELNLPVRREMWYRCRTCTRIAPSVELADKHQQEVEHGGFRTFDKSLYYCGMCQYTEGAPSSFVHHLQSNHPEYAASFGELPSRPAVERLYCCRPCEMTFPTAYLLKGHREKIHLVAYAKKSKAKKVAKATVVASSSSSDDEDASDDDDDDEQPHNYVCLYCPAVTCHTLSELEQHTARHKIKGSFWCRDPACTRGFTKYRLLEKHCQRRHPNIGYSLALYTCLWCPTVSCIKPEEMADHSLIHSINGMYSCPRDDCRRAFKHLRALEKHHKTPHRKKFISKKQREARKRLNSESDKAADSQFAVECIFCLAPLLPAEYDAHILSHRVGNQYACRICGKCFGGVLGVRQHMKAHFGSIRGSNDIPEKTCSICGRVCLSVARKASHMADHYKLKNKQINNFYKCRHCEWPFQQRTGLVDHMSYAHPDVDLSSVPELRLPWKRLEIFDCGTCDHTSETEKEAERHESTEGHQAGKMRVSSLHCCEMCDFQHRGPSVFLAHVRCHPEYAERFSDCHR